MSESVTIRELNELVAGKSNFISLITTGMGNTIVGQKHLVESLLIALLADGHILLDQVYSYTPATNALMAMARGLNVVTGGEDDYYRFIGERDNRPIINAPVDVDELTETLRAACADTAAMARRGAASRAFVEKHNAADVVARRYLDFWTQKLNEK